MKTKYKVTTLVIFVLLLMASDRCSAQSGTIQIDRLPKIDLKYSKQFTKVIAFYINPTIVNGSSSFQKWVEGYSLEQLIKMIEWKHHVSISGYKIDTTKIKVSEYYYLMVGDKKAWIGLDRKLVVKDSIEAKRLLAAAIIQ